MATDLLSLGTPPGSASVGLSSISADGRYVVFSSSAANFVAGDTNNVADIFRTDTQTGSVVRASVNSDGTELDDICTEPTISANGRYVCFVSGNAIGGAVHVKDLQTGELRRVDTTGTGQGANLSSYNASISANGQYVVFDTEATNLVAGDSSANRDVFRKDLATGAISRVSPAGFSHLFDYAGSLYPSISADGRFVAFSSNATAYVAGDTNELPDIFVRDMQSGTITRASTDSAGVEGNADSFGSMISDNGRYVAFRSRAANLVAGDTENTPDLFLKDTQTGAVTRVNTASDGVVANVEPEYTFFVTDDGDVSFTSTATNLVAGDTNNKVDVFIKDNQTQATTRASTSSAGSQASGSGGAISADGQFAVIISFAALVPGEIRPGSNIYVKSLVSGALSLATPFLPGPVTGNGSSPEAAISTSGRFVVFTSSASDLVPSDTNGSSDLFLKDKQTGTLTRISTASDGAQASGTSHSPSISGDGRMVAFSSSAKNLVPGVTDANIYVKDVQTGAVTAIDTGGSRAYALPSASPAISSNGRFVVFSTIARFVPEDTNLFSEDVYLKDLQTGAITLVSKNSEGLAGDNMSLAPAISADGRYVVFLSRAANLVAGDTNGGSGEPGWDVFRKDMQTGSIVRVSTTPAGQQVESSILDNENRVAVSANGRFVAFVSSAIDLLPGVDFPLKAHVYVKDLNTNSLIRASSKSNGVAAGSDSRLPSLSADGRYVSFISKAALVAGDTNGRADVFVKDTQTGAVVRESLAPAGDQINRDAQHATISGDGVYVAFTTTATNIGVFDGNGGPDLLLANNRVANAEVNVAPQIDTSLSPVLTAIDEDDRSSAGSRLGSLVAGVTDANAGAVKGIALTSVNVAAKGTWQYSLNDGATWLSVGTVSRSAALLLPESNTTRLRFLPASEFSGTVAIGYRAWDRTTGIAGNRVDISTSAKIGGATAFSTAAESASLTVKPMNDAPRLGLSGVIGYIHDKSAITLAPNATVSDVDSLNFYQGRLRVRITDGASTSNRLTIGAGFTVDATGNVLQGTTIIGKRTANGFGTNELIITFNTNATQAIVQQLVRAISFKTVAGAAGQRKVVFTISDGDGGLSAEVFKTVNVT